METSEVQVTTIIYFLVNVSNIPISAFLSHLEKHKANHSWSPASELNYTLHTCK